MRTSKFLLIIALVTFFALLYVWQQTEIFRLAYEGQKKQAIAQDLLDKNTLLRYNIEKNASLIRIVSKVSKATDFQMPDTYRLVKVTQPLGSLKVSKYVLKKENLLSRIFGIKRQAEAKTVDR